MGWKQPIDTDVYLWFGDDHLARDLFIHLLLKARNNDMEFPEHYKGKPFLLKRGQVIFGQNEYGRKLRCSPIGAYKALKRLEKVLSRVISKPTPDYTIITILNFDDIVGMEYAKEQAGNKQVISELYAGNTNKTVETVEIVEIVNHKYNGQFEKIVSHLNDKAKTKYRHETLKTRTLITARLDEKFTLEDFEIVIDKKCKEWIGTEHEKFIRPETLFGTKFEGYLNQHIVTKEEKFDITKPKKERVF